MHFLLFGQSHKAPLLSSDIFIFIIFCDYFQMRTMSGLDACNVFGAT